MVYAGIWLIFPVIFCNRLGFPVSCFWNEPRHTRQAMKRIPTAVAFNMVARKALLTLPFDALRRQPLSPFSATYMAQRLRCHEEYDLGSNEEGERADKANLVISALSFRELEATNGQV